MGQIDKGVLNGSVIRMCTADEQVRSMFFYPLCYGHFFCDGLYHVNRQRYDSFLLLLVLQGEGYLRIGEEKLALRRGMLALIDCYEPHSYGTDSGWEIVWCHFDGPLARSFDTRIRQHLADGRRPLSVKEASQAEAEMQAMLMGEEAMSGAQNNLHITRLLTLMLKEERGQEHTGGEMDGVLKCISEHFDQPLTVEMLSRQASLSEYHFLRVFKRETGMTPHAYLLNVRMNAACFYLRSGKLSMQEIAWRCGFESASALCKAFRRVMGVTPGEYRTTAD